MYFTTSICWVSPLTTLMIHCVPADPYSQLATFTDGLWHSVEVEVTSGASDRIGKVNVTIDGKSDVSSRQMTFSTGGDFYIGGTAVSTYSFSAWLLGYYNCLV